MLHHTNHTTASGVGLKMAALVLNKLGISSRCPDHKGSDKPQTTYLDSTTKRLSIVVFLSGNLRTDVSSANPGQNTLLGMNPMHVTPSLLRRKEMVHRLGCSGDL